MDQLELFSTSDLTSSPEERPVRTCRSRASGAAWKREATQGRRLPLSSYGSSVSFNPDSFYGRTWQEYSPTSPSRSSSPRLQTAGMVLPTERSTPNGCGARIYTTRMEEFTQWNVPSRRDEGVCGLSDVLEEMSPRLVKYFLSREALAGILRRAASRGKKLPDLLERAIAYMMEWWKVQESPVATNN